LEKLRRNFQSGILYPEHTFTVVYEDMLSVLRGGKRHFLDNYGVALDSTLVTYRVVIERRCLRLCHVFLNWSYSHAENKLRAVFMMPSKSDIGFGKP
jgi:hypothetical protein